jgi:hypothetical protein
MLPIIPTAHIIAMRAINLRRRGRINTNAAIIAKGQAGAWFPSDALADVVVTETAMCCVLKSAAMLVGLVLHVAPAGAPLQVKAIVSAENVRTLAINTS